MTWHRKRWAHKQKVHIAGLGLTPGKGTRERKDSMMLKFCLEGLTERKARGTAGNHEDSGQRVKGSPVRKGEIHGAEFGTYRVGGKGTRLRGSLHSSTSW